MWNLSRNHRQLFVVMFTVFLFLSLGIAVIPAFIVQEDNTPLPNAQPLTAQQQRGLRVYISEGCVACHTQQVRNISMDKTWGKRPSVPQDYYYSKERLNAWEQSPSLLGSERTGPDLTNIGVRQPSQDWQLMHLFNPRIVVQASVMPAFPWLFERKEKPDEAAVIVNVPKKYLKGSEKIVATQRALDLVAYLKSLQQVDMGQDAPKFLPSAKEKSTGPAANTVTAGSTEASTGSALPDGAKLYQNTCSACHQPGGTGLTGAFPPLKGSNIANAKDPTKMITIVLHGFNALKDYGPMPPFGDQLTDAEIGAILSYERSSWGNDAPAVTEEEVKKVRDSGKKPDDINL